MMVVVMTSGAVLIMWLGEIITEKGVGNGMSLLIFAGIIVNLPRAVLVTIDQLREDFSVVIVTHSMQQAARVSQKTAFFHLGNLVEYGDTDEIFTRPRDPRTESYISGRIG